jgi:retron-type reverse transcriptase
MSKAFYTVNIHSLVNKLHGTSTPNLLIKFIANYIKGRKAFTTYNNQTSKKQTLRTGVPQGGVLSPILFNLYVSDIPTPPPKVQLESYADDLTPLTSHVKVKEAEKALQPYLNDIFNWTVENDLLLNPTKSSCTLFTPDPAE